MKVLLLCLKAFETMEFSVFIDIMGWARDEEKVNIKVVTCGFNKTVISTFGVPIIMDTLMDDVDVNDYDALAIPGGFQEYGFREEAFDIKTLELIRKFNSQNKPIASICVAAFALAKSGILNGKRATTYHLLNGARQKELALYEGTIVINEPIVIDGNIITSYNPQTASGVAFKLLEILSNTEKVDSIKRMMGFIE
ncbi:DJ-1/PfpI family protein [uncultured Dysgonomonas sp.]|uniref:DJ-1/PfpI family protein n=1 Tax=uncultured Dysgonomonas sp. TaxID=206096 RepID=UPI0028054C7F|nr:DJ-1/PfpI family protein [uncultured Dysgonomonas sp.]